jgi:predicted esterase
MKKPLPKILLVLILIAGLQTGSAQTISNLKKWLAEETRPALKEQKFANIALNKDKAREASSLLTQDNKDFIRKNQAGEWQKKELAYKNYTFRFVNKVFGKKPEGGRSMYISLHGGGGAPPAVNDQQWENQKKLYAPAEGLYVVPRAPTDTWNMWHQDYMDYFLDRIIKDAIVFEDVNPNKVYILGYSAGGDGVYQLAPRLADRWAAASMMAGHPGDASVLNLRNLPFAIFQGDQDKAYDRNKWAQRWSNMLDSLQKEDLTGYTHDVHIYLDMPHWMSRRDTIAIPWMAKFTRNPLPERIVWVQDDVLRENFYWLGVPPASMKAGNEIIAECKNNVINILKSDCDSVIINLNDRMVNMDKPLTVIYKGKQIFKGKVKRTISSIAQSIKERGDDSFIFSARLVEANGKIVLP